MNTSHRAVLKLSYFAIRDAFPDACTCDLRIPGGFSHLWNEMVRDCLTLIQHGARSESRLPFLLFRVSVRLGKGSSTGCRLADRGH